MLVCKQVAAEIFFYKQAFNAELLSQREDKKGAVIHATLSASGSLFMLHNEISHLASKSPELDGSCSVVNYIYVDDMDTIIKQAGLAGAKILMAAEDQIWGDRIGRVMSPAGHVWNVATRIGQ